jgi:hypothetical protein
MALDSGVIVLKCCEQANSLIKISIGPSFGVAYSTVDNSDLMFPTDDPTWYIEVAEKRD